MAKGKVIGIILALSCLLALQHVTAEKHAPQRSTALPLTRRYTCPPGESGPLGWPGEMGPRGVKGEKGKQGENAFSAFRPPPGAPCYCPEGPKGEKGELGNPGDFGEPGDPGVPGPAGEPGDMGPRGDPGPPGVPTSTVSKQPPEAPDTLYVPVVIQGKMPTVICHHLRRHAYVPVIPNKFVGWYEPGKSGYLTFDKWLYYSSRFQCPCSTHLPSGPTPSPEELLRRLERK